MKFRGIEAIQAANVALQNREYTIVALTVDEIPGERQSTIRRFLESEIMKYRNFFPGDLRHTLELFNQIHGGTLRPGTDPMLLFAVQGKVNILDRLQIVVEESSLQWIAKKKQLAEQALERGEVTGPVLCLPDLCPYQKHKPKAICDLVSSQESNVEVLRTTLENLKHVINRFISRSSLFVYPGHQDTFNHYMTDILDLLGQSDEE